ncbi:MAG: AraC family transcriptional regulator, partial [Alphaproteobacteria bacterium]|nr:AraC family transcriptional regulator [Alphaproteobacteria bacterium]
MPIAHDQPSERLAEASETQAAALVGDFDPLSDVLRTVKLKGALFFLVDATSPWCVEVPPARDYADIILPSARHVVSYHVAVQGRGLAGLPGSEPVAFEAGDIIVFPHADPYLMSSAPGVAPELDRDQTLKFFRDLAAGKLPFVIPEGGGEPPKAKFICGFLGCDLSPFNPLFATLPRVLHIRRPDGGRADPLDQLIELAMTEIRTPRAGGESIRLGLCELMFVELLRRHLETISAEGPGWLAGLRDAKVGRALALLHAEPARDWTLDALAREAGVSRSVLAERFARCVGETPMRYLTLWRMQLAAR